jgi:hypothetical protein
MSPHGCAGAVQDRPGSPEGDPKVLGTHMDDAVVGGVLQVEQAAHALDGIVAAGDLGEEIGGLTMVLAAGTVRQASRRRQHRTRQSPPARPTTRQR